MFIAWCREWLVPFAEERHVETVSVSNIPGPRPVTALYINHEHLENETTPDPTTFILHRRQTGVKKKCYCF